VLDPGESRSIYEEFRRRAPELRRELDRPGAPVPPLAPVPPSPPAPAAPGAPRSFAPGPPREVGLTPSPETSSR
jgi:hypothetical protein